MDIPHGWVKVYDSDIGTPPAGMEAINGSNFSLSDTHLSTWAWKQPPGEDHGDGVNAVISGTGGSSKSLRTTTLTPPDGVAAYEAHDPSEWTYSDEHLLRHSLVEAEFSGIDVGSNVILELGWCAGNPWADDDSWRTNRSGRLYVVLEYRGEGWWAIGNVSRVAPI